MIYKLNDAPSEYLIANPEYISAAFDRAKVIYTNRPHKLNIFRIHGYPDDSSAQKEIQTICQIGNIPLTKSFSIRYMKGLIAGYWIMTGIK